MEKIDIILLVSTIALAICLIGAYEKQQENTSNTIQPEIIQELQEDSKFVKITIDIIKETEATQ